jgi:hypothetical protein
MLFPRKTLFAHKSRLCMVAVPIALEVTVEKLIIEKGHNLFQEFMVL